MEKGKVIYLGFSLSEVKQIWLLSATSPYRNKLKEMNEWVFLLCKGMVGQRDGNMLQVWHLAAIECKQHNSLQMCAKGKQDISLLHLWYRSMPLLLLAPRSMWLSGLQAGHRAAAADTNDPLQANPFNPWRGKNIASTKRVKSTILQYRCTRKGQ